MPRVQPNPPPFVILGTPRSRTAWLAKLLTTHGWVCLHEPSVRFGSIYDLRRMLSRKKCGASDSMMTLMWREVLDYRPQTRIVVVRRPLPEVHASFAALGHPLTPFQAALLERIESEAANVEALPGTKTVSFDRMHHDHVIQSIVGHTIGRVMDPDRIAAFQRRNIQFDIAGSAKQVAANRDGITRTFGRWFSQIESIAA